MNKTVVCAMSLSLIVLPLTDAAATRTALPDSIAKYVRPYVETKNFSGAVLVVRDGSTVFARAYGFADRAHQIPNRLDTRFHVASMSMQYTAAAALRLVQAGKLSLDMPVSTVVAGYPNGGQITVRHLLTQTSGIADINDQADYQKVLAAHQTPLSLVEKVQDLPPARVPGSYDGEEHSAYNLLALIIERRAGEPFAAAVRDLVFRPLGMSHSGIDDDGTHAARDSAIGYEPEGVYDLAPAQRIHWSAKAGNASAFTTAADQVKFVRGLQRDDFLKPELRQLVFDPATPAAYGWFKSDSKRFGQRVLSMSGRSPGFASAMIYIPKEDLIVVALSNVYASAPADIAEEIAALALNRPYEPLNLKTEVDPASLAGLPESFQFPKDFYQPNAVVDVQASRGQVSLHWPSGDTSMLIPMSRDHYIDRAYWMPVEIARDANGRITQIKYGSFTGVNVPRAAS